MRAGRPSCSRTALTLRSSRPAFPSLIRFRPRTSAAPSSRFSTASSSSPPPAAPPPASAAPAPVSKPASAEPKPKWVPAPSTQEILDRFGPPPPTTGQIARATKTHVSVKTPDGALVWELPWHSIHSISLVVDGNARSKYWVLYEKGTMAVQKISLMLPEAAELAAQMRRRTGWLRESETRAISTPIDEATKQPKGMLTFHCWTDMKAHFMRKYGPPRASDMRDQWKQKGRGRTAGGTVAKKTISVDPVLNAGTVLQSTPAAPPSTSPAGSSDASKV